MFVPGYHMVITSHPNHIHLSTYGDSLSPLMWYMVVVNKKKTICLTSSDVSGFEEISESLRNYCVEYDGIKIVRFQVKFSLTSDIQIKIDFRPELLL